MQKLRFLHIPKTAGTSFTGLLKQQLPPNSMFQFAGDMQKDMQRLKNREKDNVNKILLYSGHAPITTTIEGIDELPTITFLRDPLSRVMSYCKHVAEGKNPQILELMDSEAFDLDEFLNKGFFELHNLQTKMLVNAKHLAAPLEMSPQKAVEQAFTNLTQKLVAFGLQECFDESLIVFQTVFGWQDVSYSIQNKSNPTQLKFERRHIQRIEELNQLDIQLYKLARKEFKKRWKSIPNHRSRLKSLRSAQNQ